jgi:polyamine oxidase
MRSPVDNLFFAGEATCARFPGTVHGAFATGVMAAKECYRSFAEKNNDLALFQPVMAEAASNKLVPLRISRM